MPKRKIENHEPEKTVMDKKTLTEMTREQLVEVAAEYGINLTDEASNDDIIEAILDTKGNEEGNDEIAGEDDYTSNDEAAVKQGNDENAEGDDSDTPNDEAADEDESDLDEDEFLVVSETRKGKKIIAVSGKVIAFDKEGKAKVGKADYDYLKARQGFKVK